MNLCKRVPIYHPLLLWVLVAFQKYVSKVQMLLLFFFFFRILEFENPHVTSNNKGTGCEFELWDCGGDPKYVSFKRVCFIK